MGELIIKTKNGFLAKAPAKLNITLSIGEKDPKNGYHHIESTIQAVTLFDYIEMEKTTAGEVSIEGCSVEDNLIGKAMRILEEKSKKKLPAKITCHKVIPQAAGMGGGSSDAAATLKLANKLFELNYSNETLEGLASELGNDVAFFVRGGRAKISGTKKHSITELEVPKLYYLIARPHKRLSTAQMYKLHDETKKSFIEIATSFCPEIPKLLEQMKKNSVESGLTGKGPTVFASYKTYKECAEAEKKVLWLNGDIFIARALEKD